MRHIGLSLSLALCGCGDETISGFTDPDLVYHLVEIDGTPFPADAAIVFPAPGRVHGTGPCNQWSAAQTAPYPWIELGPIAATRRACAALALETRFFRRLGQMRFAEVSGPLLILSNDEGGTLVFAANP